MIECLKCLHAFNLGRKIHPSTQLCYPNLWCLLFPLVNREDWRPLGENLRKLKSSLLSFVHHSTWEFILSWLCPVRVFSLAEIRRRCCCFLSSSVTWRQTTHFSFLNVGSSTSALTVGVLPKSLTVCPDSWVFHCLMGSQVIVAGTWGSWACHPKNRRTFYRRDDVDFNMLKSKAKANWNAVNVGLIGSFPASVYHCVINTGWWQKWR